MVEMNRILCPVDVTELSSRPLAYAAAIAEWYGGVVTVLHVAPTFEPMEVRPGALFDPIQFVNPVPRGEILEQLRLAAADAGVATGRVAFAAEAGDPAATIVDQAVAGQSDLVVMATHGRRGLDRFLLGSVTETVLRDAPCPVMTVPPHAPDAPAGVALRRILCPVDFSPASLLALGFAVDLARRAEASLTVLQVIEWLAEEEPREPAHFDVPEFRRHLMQDTHDRLEELLGQQPRVEQGARATVGAGRAYREILRVAADGDAGLIVMGTHGRGGPAIIPLGSTTHQVVRAASCPVLTVRAPVSAA